MPENTHQTVPFTVTLPVHYVAFMKSLQAAMPTVWNDWVESLVEQCTVDFGTAEDEAIDLTVECIEWDSEEQKEAAVAAVLDAQRAFLRAEGKTEDEIAALEARGAQISATKKLRGRKNDL